MKIRLGYLLPILPFSFSAFPLFAHHLDGLWRNDRENISLRIETTDQGFKAKRLDQGIWYFYVEDRDHFYVDRKGNYYEILDEDHIAWHDARADKRIDFHRADTYDSDDQYANNEDDYWDNGYPDDQWSRYNDQKWNGRPQDWKRSDLDGLWYSKGGRFQVELDWKRDGLRLRRPDGRWTGFEETRHYGEYLSRNGSLIRLLNDHTFLWKNSNGNTLVFHKGNSRDRSWH